MINNSECFINGVNKAAIADFFKECKKIKADVHRLEIIENGEIKAKIAPRPYSLEDKQQLYSLSKSFTSTAIGFPVDEGKVSVEDYMIDIFADRIDGEPCDNMKKVQLRHVLSMNTGHKECILHLIKHSDDPAREWFKTNVEFEPGTHFTYNNSATYMLSEVVRKYTGMSVVDYLSKKLFKPLGITGVKWDAFACGNSQGAVGLHAGIDDIAKLGLLYLNKGVWNGQRILSENWVNMASSVHSDNSENGTPDWTAGYGFQFWNNAGEGFRGDGAWGQLCMVYPERNMIIAVQAYVEAMQQEIDAVNRLCDNIHSADDISETELVSLLDGFNPICGYSEPNTDVFGDVYGCNANSMGITRLYFENNDECVSAVFSNGEEWQKINFGKGEFTINNIHLPYFKPMIDALMLPEKDENIKTACCCTFADNAIKATVRYIDNPHIQTMIFEFSGDFSEVKMYKYTAENEKKVLLEGKKD